MQDGSGMQSVGTLDMKGVEGKGNVQAVPI